VAGYGRPCPACGRPTTHLGCPYCRSKGRRSVYSGGDWGGGGGEGGDPGGPIIPPSTEPALQQTLFATGGRESRVSSGSGTEIDANTAAGTHDDNDLTLDTFLADASSTATQQVVYSMDPASFAGTIDFLILRFRGGINQNSATSGGSLRGIKATAGFGAVQTCGNNSPITAEELPANLDSGDVLVDPLDSTPWTAAKINAYKWGVAMTIESGEDANVVYCTEFKIEVWGH
jgi:hypothetical protein